MKVWMTATINNVEVSTEPEYFDYVFYNESNPTPIIGCPYREVETKQYINTPIRYTVYRNGYINHKIIISVSDEEENREKNTDKFNNTYDFKSAVEKEVKITFTYDWEEDEKYTPVYKTVKVKCASLGYEIGIAEDAALDFDPTGRTNEEVEKLEDGTAIAWTDGTHSLRTSSNFNWSLGGY
jgi:hypothetical protein